MPPVRKKWGKQVRLKLWKPLVTTQTGQLPSVFLRITLLSLIFLSLQTFGQGLDICFDSTREGTFCKHYLTCIYFLAQCMINHKLIDVLNLRRRCGKSK